MEKLTLTQVKSLIKKNECAFIRLVPSKMSPVGMWRLWHDTEITETTTVEEFEKIVNSFSWYNCTAETGKCVHYYLIDKIQQ